MLAGVATALLAVVVIGPSDLEASSGPPCDDAEGFAVLDFWLGEWDVLVGEQRVGRNRIEKILDGCAVMEHWTGAGGGQGKSLFFYQPHTETWKQVWVTEDATRPGGIKEKTLVEVLPDGAVRFQGTIPTPDGGSYFDRTTLTPLGDGSVRQVIEISQDGNEWRSTFDALYVRATGDQEGP